MSAALIGGASSASAAPALSASIGNGVCNLNEGTPAIAAPGVFVTVGNAGTDPGDYRIIVDGSAYIGGATAPAGSAGGPQGIVLHNQYSLIEVRSGTVSQPGDNTLIASKVVAINNCDAVAAPTGTVTATIGDAVCNVNAGTPAIIVAGSFVNVKNNTDQPAVERILKNGTQYIGPGVLLPGQSDGGGAVVLGFQDSATIAVEINGQIVASKSVTTNCTPDGLPIVVAPTTTPPVTTAPPTVAPSTTAATTPAATTPAATATSTAAGLAATGASHTGSMTGIAMALLVGGTGLVWLTRRTRTARRH